MSVLPTDLEDNRVIVSHERRVLFIHVQKTGGSTLDELLLARLPGAERVSGLAGGRHSTWTQAVQRMPEVAEYTTFGFVRNPWARLYSWHAMVMRRRENAEAGNDSLARRIERARFWGGVVERHDDFESFVMKAPDEFSRLRRPQIDYLTHRGREADFIGHTESYDDDLSRLANTLEFELPEQIRRVNRGPRTDYRAHFTDDMAARVAAVFRADVERFGYEF